MSLLAEWTTVVFIMRVIVCACGGTSLREISELMNMYSMFPIGVESFDGACYFDWGLYGILTEGDEASNIGFIGV